MAVPMHASDFDLATATGASASGISRRRKAAMVVQLILAEGQALSLSKLPEQLQLDLTRELGALRIIDKRTIDSVAAEFLKDLESVGLSAPGGLAAALTALRDRISPAAAARLRAESGGEELDPWQQICALDTADLAAIMQAEGIEIAAVALSKLPVAKAAEVLGKLPGERARRIAFAVSQTASVTPEAVRRIGAALTSEYGEKPATAFAEEPAARVGAILNSSLAAMRDSVLEGLGSESPEFAEGVRRNIFTFANIPERVAPVDLPKVTRAVDNEVLVVALAAAMGGNEAEQGAADYLLSNISQRMADALREEVGERARPRRSEGEEAMGQVVGAIRAAVTAGEFKLIEPEEADGAEDEA